MAAIPAYITWVSGTVVTAAQLNAQIRDAGNFDLARPYCNIYNSAGVTAGTSGTYVLIPWDTNIESNDSMHSTSSNNSRVIGNTLGVFHIINSTSWASSATGFRGTMMRLNSAGSSVGGTTLQYAFGFSIGASAWLGGPRCAWYYRFANIGDYIETFADQTSTASLAITGGQTATVFQCMWEIA